MKALLEPLRLELKVNWKLSRNEALYKENYRVIFELDGKQGAGEAAPNIRYGETPQNLEEQFEKLPRFNDPDEALAYCENADLFHSLKCGLVCAAVELKAKLSDRSVEEELGIKQAREISTSISVPIMEEDLLEDYLSKIKRFPYVKIKVSQDNAVSFVKKIACLSAKPLRVDANEGFESVEAFMRFCEEVKNLNIQFIEQPFKAKDVSKYLEVRGKTPFEIMADESIEDEANFDSLAKQFDSVNIKLMKTGGYFKAIELARQARSRGMKVMFGCMIESSLGISCAMRLGELGDYFDLDGSLLLKNEPFGLIKEKEGLLALS